VRIGVVADTHVGEHVARLPAAVGRALAGVDLIIHAGDLSVIEVLDDLRVLAPVVAVRGNHDRGPAARLPRDLVVRVGAVRLGVTHGTRGVLPQALTGAAALIGGRLPLGGVLRAARRRFGAVDAVVFGHLHVPVHARQGGALMFSPGAVHIGGPGGARPSSPVTRVLHRRFRAACPPGADTPRVGILEVTAGSVRAWSVPLADDAASAEGLGD
jgi:uncharacterized protein